MLGWNMMQRDISQKCKPVDSERKQCDLMKKAEGWDWSVSTITAVVHDEVTNSQTKDSLLGAMTTTK